MKHIFKCMYAILLGTLLSLGMAIPAYAGDQGVTDKNFTVWIIVGVILVAMFIALTIVQKVRKSGKDE